MARPLRIEFSGAFYHVIQRGLEKKEIFTTPKDFEKFLTYIENACLKYNIIIHAYCLMKNHYHLIIETSRPNLSKAMHYINASYTIYYNIKRNRRGPLYQGRYKAILVKHDEYLHYLSCYVHLNPVRAHIVENPINYPYSSYRYFVSAIKPPIWLNVDLTLSMFDTKIIKAKKLYKDFVLSQIGKEKKIIEENTIYGIVLGNKSYLHWIQETFLKEKKDDKETPVLRKLQPRPDPVNIVNYIKSKTTSRDAKKFSVYFIHKYSDLTLKDIASIFTNLTYAAVSKIYKRTEEKLKTDGRLSQIAEELEKGLMSKVKT